MSGLVAEAVDLAGEPEEAWDRAIEASVNGTLFHLRRFLAYHGTRFAGRERFVGFAVAGRLAARIAYAVAIQPDGRRVLTSPYGGSYGGFVFPNYPSFREALAIAAAFRALVEREADEAHLALPIAACHEAPLDTANFALMHVGFRSLIRDVTSVFVRRDEPTRLSERARRSARKAEAHGVTIDWTPPLDDFWTVMEATYAKHGTRPTHSRAEIADLNRRLGGTIRWPTAYLRGTPVAALGCFRINRRVDSAFYICQDPRLQDSQALTFLIGEQLKRLPDEVRFFSFGTSSYDMSPRPNVFEFKENFTRIGMFRETFAWFIE